jgi:hypothetical protein
VIALAASPPEVRKVSDLPKTRGYAPNFELGQSELDQKLAKRSMIKFTMFLFRVVILVALAFALGTLACGQGLPAPQGRSGRTDKIQRELQRQVEMRLLEQALMEGSSRHVKRYEPQVLNQIREDFLQIQVIDREVIRAKALGDQLDLHLVTKSAGEIRKRSSRLKENLALPRSEAARADRSRVAVEATSEALRTSLAELSDLIEEFVSNPMFEQSKVVDPRLSAKARQDIEAIIELSKQIKRSSEKLRAAGKSR